MIQQQKPQQAKTQKTSFKKEDAWDYALFMQVNRINQLMLNVWEEPQTAKYKLLNLTASIMQLEFMVWHKINIPENSESKAEYYKAIPQEFKDLEKSTITLHRLLDSNEMEQLKYVIKLNNWLKVLDNYLDNLKKLKKASDININGSD